MMNQSAGPANTGDILYFMRVTLFVALLCMGYSLSRPTPAKGKEQDLLLPATAGAGSADRSGQACRQWQKKASEKAVESYAAAQEKKWRRWNEAMFERSS